jgi:hypothetical protein
VLSLLAVMAVVEYVFPSLELEAKVTVGFLKEVTAKTAPSFGLSTMIKGTPWHTFCLMALWFWCACQVAYGDENPSEPNGS